jgi:hypothetical protein
MLAAGDVSCTTGVTARLNGMVAVKPGCCEVLRLLVSLQVAVALQ